MIVRRIVPARYAILRAKKGEDFRRRAIIMYSICKCKVAARKRILAVWSNLINHHIRRPEEKDTLVAPF